MPRGHLLTQDIKRLLYRTGGVVVAPRRTGKTQALIELLGQSQTSIVFVLNPAARSHLFERYREFYQRELHQLRVYTSGDGPRFWRGRASLDTDVYVDDLYQSAYRGPCNYALTSINDDDTREPFFVPVRSS